MNRDQKYDDFLTFLLAVIMAAAIVTAGWILKKVLWPSICYISKKIWAFVCKQYNKPKVVKEKAQAIELPTPEIFKGATNLAPAKEYRIN